MDSIRSALGWSKQAPGGYIVAEDAAAEMAEAMLGSDAPKEEADTSEDTKKVDSSNRLRNDSNLRIEEDPTQPSEPWEFLEKAAVEENPIVRRRRSPATSPSAVQKSPPLSPAAFQAPVYNGAGVGLLYDARMAEHRTLQENYLHPEQPARILRIFEHLELEGLAERCVRIPCREATRAELEVKHTAEHVEAMIQVAKLNEGQARKRGDSYDSLFLCPESTQAALLSAGAVLEAVERVCSGDVSSAVCVVRPPGHHAEKDAPQGFCLFGNVGVAVAEARRRGLSKRTLIVDWDIHHGNGTQRMFEDDDSVLFFSIHRHDNGRFYPCKPYGGHTSHGVEGASGYSVNVPWDVRAGQKKINAGAPGDVEYLEAFAEVLLPIAAEFDPDLVMISAGFDSAMGDPIGECCVTPEGYQELTRQLLQLARGRLVLALEGGYNLDSISASMAACVRAMLGEEAPTAVPRPVIPHYAETIERVRFHYAQFWPSLRREGDDVVRKLLEVRVPAAALKGTWEQMEKALAEKAEEMDVPVARLRQKQQASLFKLSEVPQLLPPASDRKELGQVFAGRNVRGLAVLPVIYISSPEQAVRNARVAFDAGAHGIWLVNEGHAHLPPEAAMKGVEPSRQKTGLKTSPGPTGRAGKAQLNALEECYTAVRKEFVGRWIGLGVHQLPAAMVFKWVASTCPKADAVWIDELPCKPADIAWEEDKAVRLEKWLGDAQAALKAVRRERQSSKWAGLVFGSVAGRYQELLHHQQDSQDGMDEACQVLLQHCASLAGSVCDVFVMSGRQRGEACSAAKLRALTGLGQLALLSGGTAVQAAEASYAGCVGAVLVDAMLDQETSELGELDAAAISAWHRP